jgi:uncharacterized delta-60 repeat protein
VVLALGYLDPLFGAPNGYVTVDHPYTDSIVQSDGKILVLGNGNLVRLLQDGAVDTSFGTNGTVVFPVDRAAALAQAPDGKIIVVGICDLTSDGSATDVSISYLLLSGQIDPAFNGGSTACRSVGVLSDPQNHFSVNDVSVQSNGNVVVLGTYMFVGDNIGGYSFISDFDPYGNLNPAFGTTGRFFATIPNPPGGSSFGFGQVLVQADDSILVLGTVSDWRGTSGDLAYLVLMRLTSAGQQDSSFGTAGYFVYSNSAQDEWGSRLVVQRSGRIIVAGSERPTGGVITPMLLGVTSAGVLDTSFGTSGKAQVADGLADLLVLADDSLVTTGFSSANGKLAVHGFLPNGAVDASFANAGTALIDVLSTPYALRTQPNGQILILGKTTAADQMYVARLGSEFVPQPVFADVSFGYWASSWIERLYSAGITSGCAVSPSVLYCPEGTVTRAQMAVFLLRGEHGSSYAPPAATGSLFADVPLSNGFAKWIEQLSAEGITSGCGGGNYCPDNPVTRGQMAVFLLRGEHGTGYTPPAASGTLFTDVPASNGFAAWIEQLSNEGITGGCGGGNYCPDAPVTRAQMAVFLVKTFSLP